MKVEEQLSQEEKQITEDMANSKMVETPEWSFVEPALEQKTQIIYSKIGNEPLGLFSEVTLKTEKLESDQKEHIVT